MTKATQAPTRFDPATIVLVECGFPNDRYFEQRSTADANLATTIADLIAGQFDRPLRVLAFGTDTPDISEDVALAILQRQAVEGCDLTSGVAAFVDRHLAYQRAA